MNTLAFSPTLVYIIFQLNLYHKLPNGHRTETEDIKLTKFLTSISRATLGVRPVPPSTFTSGTQTKVN